MRAFFHGATSFHRSLNKCAPANPLTGAPVYLNARLRDLAIPKWAVPVVLLRNSPDNLRTRNSRRRKPEPQLEQRNWRQEQSNLQPPEQSSLLQLAPSSLRMQRDEQIDGLIAALDDAHVHDQETHELGPYVRKLRRCSLQLVRCSQQKNGLPGRLPAPQVRFPPPR